MPCQKASSLESLSVCIPTKPLCTPCPRGDANPWWVKDDRGSCLQHLPVKFHWRCRQGVLLCLHYLPARTSEQKALPVSLGFLDLCVCSKSSQHSLLVIASLCPRDESTWDWLCHGFQNGFALICSLLCPSVEKESLYRICVLYHTQKPIRPVLYWCVKGRKFWFWDPSAGRLCTYTGITHYSLTLTKKSEIPA